MEVLAEEVEVPVERQLPNMGSIPHNRPIRLGDKVRLRSLNTVGLVSALGEEEAEVQVGVLRVRARLSDLVLARLTDEPAHEAGCAPGCPPPPIGRVIR